MKPLAVLPDPAGSAALCRVRVSSARGSRCQVDTPLYMPVSRRRSLPQALAAAHAERRGKDRAMSGWALGMTPEPLFTCL